MPQGSVISSLLFSLFINNILKRNKTNNELSLLFADELVTFFIYKKDEKLENKVNNYFEEIEHWLCKISVEKSCSIVLSKYKKKRPINLDHKTNRN